MNKDNLNKKNDFVTIIVDLEFFPEHTDEAKNLLRALADESDKEEGCLSYSLYNDKNNPNAFILFEIFENKEAQDFHKTTTHYKEILQEKLPSMIKERRVRFLGNL